MSEETLNFIRSTFQSVWALEMMLFMREQPDRAWSEDELVTELRGSPVIVDVNLRALIAAGLVADRGGGRFGYHPATTQADRSAAAAAELYSTRPDAVRRVILAGPTEKFQALADAFRLRRD